MHLGDFNTQRDEIAILCHEHAHLYEKHGERVVFWQHNFARELLHNLRHPNRELNVFGSDEPLVAVVALTDNAWENRMYNHPNDGLCDPIPNLELFDNYMEVWGRGVYYEHGDWNPDMIGTRIVTARNSMIKEFNDWWAKITEAWKR